MGALAQLQRGLGIVQKAPGESRVISTVSDYYGAEAQHPSRWQDLTTAYRVHPWTFAAIKAIAMAAADVPIRALELPKSMRNTTLAGYKRRKGIGRWDQVLPMMKQEGAEVIDAHPMLDLLVNPMPDRSITQNDLIQATVTYLELEGEAYWERLWQNDQRTKMVGLWPKIDPRKVWVLPGETRLADGYVYRGGVAPVVFDYRDMIQFAYFHPESPYYGLAPTEVLRQAILADVKAIDWNRTFFDNDATPGFTLQTDQDMTTQQAREIEARWDALSRGVDKSHRTRVLAKGLKAMPVSPTHKDMQFTALRGWNREEVLAAYGVPPIVVGLYKEVNRAAATTMRRLFWENTVVPRLGKLEAVLNAQLVPEGDVRLFFDLSEIEALQEDMAEKADLGLKLMDQAWTPNELREFWGKEQGDEDALNSVYGRMGIQPLGTIKTTKSVSMSTKKLKDIAGDPAVFLPDIDKELRSVTAICERHLPGLVGEGGERAARVLSGMGVSVPEDWFTRYAFQSHITAWMETHVPKLAGGLVDETRREVLDVVREGMRDGQGTDVIARRLRDQFEWMGRVRAERIARTETLQAVSLGQHKLYQDTGVEKKEWLHALHGDSREGHEALHGTVVAMDEPFLNPVTGIQLQYPGDASAGPGEIVNCRCAEAPVSTGLQEADADVFVKEWDSWLTKAEENEGAAFQADIAGWFEAEGERYVQHLYAVAGR